jgi:hypothetical protein
MAAGQCGDQARPAIAWSSFVAGIGRDCERQKSRPRSGGPLGLDASNRETVPIAEILAGLGTFEKHAISGRLARTNW